MNDWLLTNEEREVWGSELLRFFRDDVYNPSYELDTVALEACKRQHRKTLEKVWEWGEETCKNPTHYRMYRGAIYPHVKRRTCDKCWADLMGAILTRTTQP